MRSDLDGDTERRLKRGEIAIDAKLDLHGMTEAQAHAALLRFVDRQIKSAGRMLLIVTGKGKDGAGVLRTNVPRWLEASPFAERIQAIRPAALHHGGAGALYVMVRKRPTK